MVCHDNRLGDEDESGRLTILSCVLLTIWRALEADNKGTCDQSLQH
ncbi:hypothetical protein DsansV1_C08g0084771 [Dioscorea sansibarensis]